MLIYIRQLATLSLLTYERMRRNEEGLEEKIRPRTVFSNRKTGFYNL